VWSKYSCGLAVVILQEAAQSLFAAHAARNAADVFLLAWKQQNVSFALMVPLLKEMGWHPALAADRRRAGARFEINNRW
jgi:hypothetical protein